MVSDVPRRTRRPRSVLPDWAGPSLFIETAQQSKQPARARRHMRSHRCPPESTPTFTPTQRSSSRRDSGMKRLTRPWQKVLARKRIVGLINLCVFFILSWQMVSILRMGGDVDLPSKILDSMKLEELPYPLNIVVQVHRKNITLSPFEAKIQFPGYVKVREGTFRNKHPSTTLEGSGTFDGIYVLTSEKCEHQWDEFQRLANAVPLQYTRWLQTEPRQISLADPPLPLAPEAAMDKVTGRKFVKSHLKRQVAYLDAHRGIWQFVVATGRQRVLVLDDTLFPNARLRQSMPSLLTNVDQESVARQMRWHFIFLRRQVYQSGRKEPTWTMNSVFNHAVVHAHASYGAGAYVLSQDGAQFLLKHVTQYRAPLDVEIGLLQGEFPQEFLALSACNNDAPTPFCPEIIDDISTLQTSHTPSCAWRRAQEKRMSNSFQSYLTV